MNNITLTSSKTRNQAAQQQQQEAPASQQAHKVGSKQLSVHMSKKRNADDQLRYQFDQQCSMNPVDILQNSGVKNSKHRKIVPLNPSDAIHTDDKIKVLSQEELCNLPKSTFSKPNNNPFELQQLRSANMTNEPLFTLGGANQLISSKQRTQIKQENPKFVPMPENILQKTEQVMLKPTTNGSQNKIPVLTPLVSSSDKFDQVNQKELEERKEPLTANSFALNQSVEYFATSSKKPQAQATKFSLDGSEKSDRSRKRSLSSDEGRKSRNNSQLSSQLNFELLANQENPPTEFIDNLRQEDSSVGMAVFRDCLAAFNEHQQQRDSSPNEFQSIRDVPFSILNSVEKDADDRNINNDNLSSLGNLDNKSMFGIPTFDTNVAEKNGEYGHNAFLDNSHLEQAPCISFKDSQVDESHQTLNCAFMCSQSQISHDQQCLVSGGHRHMDSVDKAKRNNNQYEQEALPWSITEAIEQDRGRQSIQHAKGSHPGSLNNQVD